MVYKGLTETYTNTHIYNYALFPNVTQSVKPNWLFQPQSG